MHARKVIHPLLLEPNYWRTRLETLKSRRPSVMLMPRPDLSGGGKDVVEFRLRAHDGQRLWGLLARPLWHKGSRPARVRFVGPTQRATLDCVALEDGFAELVFQEPAGRRLEDRVLDVLRVCQLARGTKGIDCERIALTAPDEREPDEFLIARELFEAAFQA